MKPVRVKTVQIKAGQVKLASAGPSQPARNDQFDIAGPARRCTGDLGRHRRQGRRQQLRRRPKCRRSRPISAPATACSASCRPRAHRRRRPRRRWPMPIPNLILRVAPVAAAGGSAERRHQAGRDPYRLDHPGRRAGKRKRSPRAHRSGAQPGPRPAQQGRSLYRSGGRQRRPKTVPRPFRRPRPRPGRSGLPDPEAFRHLLHHRSGTDPAVKRSTEAKNQAVCFRQAAFLLPGRPPLEWTVNRAPQTSRQGLAATTN